MPRRPLADYEKKRDFTSTTEPSGRAEFSSDGPLRFMVHKHTATNMHYDLRLELDGVLLSWAIPKGPSADTGERRLAVHVEDHPLDYAGYEGVIPKGEYGGGPSLIWDAGTFSPDEHGKTYFDDRAGAEKELREGLKNGKISVLLRGKKLKGSYALVHTKKEGKEWLILKHRDDAANPGRDIIDDGYSVASGHDTESLRENPDDSGTKYGGLGSPAFVARAEPGRLAFVEPMLAMRAAVPKHDGWVYEPKMDGIRAMVAIDHGKVTIRSRGNRDITSVYPALAEALKGQPVATALLDGEIVAVNDAGRPSFERIQKRMNLKDPTQIATADRDIPVTFFAFDIIHLDGFDLRAASLSDRREMLSRVILPTPFVQQVFAIELDADAAFEMCIAAGFEGIVAKRNGSRYEPGKRSGAWVKRRAQNRETFVVGGFSRGTGSREASFGGLLIGTPQADGKLIYSGRVGSGFTGKEVDAVMARLSPHITKTSPFVGEVPDAKVTTWVAPEMMVDVEFLEVTSVGVLRAPVFKGFVDGTPAMRFTDGDIPDDDDPEVADEPGPRTEDPLPAAKSEPRADASRVGDSPPKTRRRPPSRPVQPAAEIAEAEQPEPKKRTTRATKATVEAAGAPSASTVRATPPTGNEETAAPAGTGDNGSPAERASLIEQIRSAKKQNVTLEGEGWSLGVTNLDKEMWPATEGQRAVTKRDLFVYAVQCSHLALPHLRDRPLTLLRFPNGIYGKKFYQRHWQHDLEPFLETVMVWGEGESEDRRFLMCNNLPSLLWFCQIADIEWHATLSRAVVGPDGRGLSTDFAGSVETLEQSTLNHPDFMLFDLDPYIFAGHEKKGAEPEPNRPSFEMTTEVAHALKELLDSLGLRSFVKTSGATGIHIYVPIIRGPGMDYGVVRAAATTIFGELAARRPKDVTIEWQTTKRTGKVFLDANQNARIKSLAAAFSPRAKPGAPVSIPYEWQDLGSVYPGDTTILEPWWLDRADPWAGIIEAKNDLARILGL